MNKLTLLSVNTNYRSDYITHTGRNPTTIELRMELSVNDSSSSFNICDIIPSIIAFAENRNNPSAQDIIPQLLERELKTNFTLEEIKRALYEQYPEKFY